ncbi:MAG TPA: DUF4317 domain-containing protein [Anaerovoracaceae bacterium]|nr:DUF4317 domain-containing protein [Anaerovoracaceae bacterium]
MTKKDMMELRRRFTKEDCTFTKMVGCYVNSEKEKILSFSENFLNLEKSEFNKYLDIAKKTTGGKIGNNLLKLGFKTQEKIEESSQRLLLGIRDSGLKDKELLNCLYDLIIENYDYSGNYLILLYHDVYDVIAKTSDNIKMDDSSELYEYVICSICPVELSKPGLGYIKEENRIGNRIRDWVVKAPDNGFIYPVFNDRSSDINSIMYFTRNIKSPKTKFMENGLGCISKLTNEEEKVSFQNILKDTLGKENDVIINDINNRLKDITEFEEPIELDNTLLKDVLVESKVPEEFIPKIEADYTHFFKENLPIADSVLDKKIIKKAQEKQVDEILEAKKNSTVFININEGLGREIKKDIVEGKECLIIPLDEDSEIKINGKEM